jgi:glycosyltransferase involved in cell wall biosynthesis
MEKLILEIVDNARMSLQNGKIRHVNNLCKLFENDKDIKLIAMERLPAKYISAIRKFVYKYLSLKNELLKAKYHCIHIHGYTDILIWQVLKIAVKYNIPIIYSPHYHPFEVLTHPRQGWVYFHFFIKKYLKHISKIVTINNDDTLFYSRYSNNVYKIPHWINNDLKNRPKNKVANMILFVGRIASNKGLEYLNLLKDNIDYNIHCITSAPITGNFTIHSEVSESELQNLYQNASLVIVPSKYEAFSYVCLEALVNGTPVLISDRIRILDYIKDVSGVTVFEYGNKADFIKKIDIAMKQEVDVNAVYEIFSKEKAYRAYKKIFSLGN